MTDLINLPGTIYSKYALPIDYMPSRDLRPRWGYSAPSLSWMTEWFRAHSESYIAFWAKMEIAVEILRDIPVHFTEANLPLPAWLDVPYAPFDAVALVTMIHEHKPKRYLEIGSGISTCFARFAVDKWGLETTVTSIDPQPRTQVDAICDSVIRDGLETCDMAPFEALEPGDILFLDGSHRSFMNSDVTVFFGDVLPRIAPGVIIHIHDIALPYDYSDMFQNWYWNEQYLLMALFLGARDKIEPLLPTAFICADPSTSSIIYPLVDLPENAGWKGGGAMWFTLKARLG